MKSPVAFLLFTMLYGDGLTEAPLSARIARDSPQEPAAQEGRVSFKMNAPACITRDLPAARDGEMLRGVVNVECSEVQRLDLT